MWPKERYQPTLRARRIRAGADLLIESQGALVMKRKNEVEINLQQHNVIHLTEEIKKRPTKFWHHSTALRLERQFCLEIVKNFENSINTFENTLSSDQMLSNQKKKALPSDFE